MWRLQVTGAFFFISLFLISIASLVPDCATAAALIYVGIMMMNSARNINWLKTEEAVLAFMILAMLPMTYNIFYGIAFGVISHVLISVLTQFEIKIRMGTVTIIKT